MNVPEFVNMLLAREVVFSPNNGRLQWHDPKQAITAMGRQFLREHKAEVIAYLAQRTINPVFVDPQALLDSYINRVLHSLNETILRQLPDNSIDAFISDSPYGIDLLKAQWDESVPKIEFWRQIHRVMKPGAFAVVMSSVRQDVLAENIITLRRAGFHVSWPSLYWARSGGRPKGANVSKMIDKKLNRQGEIIGTRKVLNPQAFENGTLGGAARAGDIPRYIDMPISLPSSDKAKEMSGAFTGYRPKDAVEVIIIAMKPLSEKTYTAQAMANGKGCARFEDCRIPYAQGETPPIRDLVKQVSSSSGAEIASIGNDWHGDEKGRFASNLLVSDGVLGNSSKYYDLDRWEEEFIKRLPPECQATYPYLVVSRPSPEEKHAGLPEGMRNTNPCVKPIKLMAYLVTMFSRPGDLILDPFTGSGSTLIAAKLLGRNFIGIEQSAEYHAIAEARVNHAGPDDKYLRKITARAKAADDAADIAAMGKPPAGFFSNMPPFAATACADTDPSEEEDAA